MAQNSKFNILQYNIIIHNTIISPPYIHYRSIPDEMQPDVDNIYLYIIYLKCLYTKLSQSTRLALSTSKNQHHNNGMF